MKTLLLSNYLAIEHFTDLIVCKWGEDHPSLADFHCAILDMKLDNNPNVREVSLPGYPFYSLFDDAIRLLRAGGVIIALNYFTYVNKGSPYVTANKTKPPKIASCVSPSPQMPAILPSMSSTGFTAEIIVSVIL